MRRLVLIFVLLSGGCDVFSNRSVGSVSPQAQPRVLAALSDAELASVYGNQELTFKTRRGRTVVVARLASVGELGVVRAMAVEQMDNWWFDASADATFRNIT